MDNGNEKSNKSKPTRTNSLILVNNLIAYLFLAVGFGSYLYILLSEKDFVPSRIGLALNTCSGLIVLATGQITAFVAQEKEKD